jgi:MOSC domain-containing protein YiiM
LRANAGLGMLGLNGGSVSAMIIEQIFTSPGHNYYGHHGQPPDDFPLVESSNVECVAGQGIRGDRFFDYADDYKGQITFFSREVFDLMSQAFGLTTKSPGVLRRNVIVSGVNLPELIGADFELQGVQFRGTAHCAPCHWMDTAFAPGAEKFLAGRGGLRARILTDGRLGVGDAQLRVLQPAVAKIA